MNQNSTKRGVASLYVVIFATILFGVVTLSFMRIILSEAGQSSDDDLSRSAYDSAMAGVEDAKTAINRYYACLSAGGGQDCDADDKNNLFQKNCNDSIGLAKYLYPSNYTGGEVLIQESTDRDNQSDQAYTCVVISDEVEDYRGTLTSDTRVKMIPLSVFDGGAGNSELPSVKKIRFQWYSSLNLGDKEFNTSTDKRLNQNGTTPPTISLTFVRMKTNIQSTEFEQANDTSNLNYDTMVLLPGGDTTSISSSEIVQAGNIAKDAKNEPIRVQCSKTNADFACSVDLEVNGQLTLNSTDSVFLIAALPYGEAATDFAATMLKDDSTRVMLKGAQISVDSTGRTNQLVRRVETRLDPADLFFPYPQYELELTGGDGDILKKNFWITANCWKSSNGGAQRCNNNAEITE